MELGFALDEAGDAREAEQHLRRAAALFGAAGPPEDEGRALSHLASLLARTSRAELAGGPLERALSLHADDPDARAADLLVKGAVELTNGRVAEARAATEESLSLARARGEGRSSGLARMQLGDIARTAGDLASARDAFEHAASTFAEHGFGALAAIAGARVGALAKEQGRAAEAQLRLRESRDALAALGRTHDAAAIDAMLAELTAPSSAGPRVREDALLVAAGGAWFRAPRGERAGLERRRPLARITERLAIERTERPGSSLPTRALQDAAWPGDKLVASAGAHRVRVAISSLRKLGLPVVTSPAGYALDPAVPIVRV